jgi:hypothetical protein
MLDRSSNNLNFWDFAFVTISQLPLTCISKTHSTIGMTQLSYQYSMEHLNSIYK